MHKHTGKSGGFRIDFNAPVILGMSFLSLALLVLNSLLGQRLNPMLAAYFTRWGDVWMYPRLLTHVLMHQNLAHYTGNFMMILAVGPMVEEKYGSKRLLGMIVITALITGFMHILFTRQAMLMGASSIVFMLILLASFANMREGRLPLTVILVALLYIGNEIITGLTVHDTISHVSHILGGLCGAAFGFLYKGKRTSGD